VHINLPHLQPFTSAHPCHVHIQILACAVALVQHSEISRQHIENDIDKCVHYTADSKLVRAIADLMCSPVWSEAVLLALKRSFQLLVDSFTLPPADVPVVRYDFVELWWSSAEGGTRRGGPESDEWTSRPSPDSKPSIILYAASAPEPRRMLLYLSGPKGDIGQARSYRIDSFEAPGMHVWLRPLPSPGRTHAAPERHSLYNLVCNARSKGCTMLVQSLELLLLVMKGEASGTASGQFSGATLPTGAPALVMSISSPSTICMFASRQKYRSIVTNFTGLMKSNKISHKKAPNDVRSRRQSVVRAGGSHHSRGPTVG
jgi:hypothetical protein